MASSDESGSEAALDAKHRVFAFLWAIGLLFDASNRGLALDPCAALVTAGAALVVLWPANTLALAVLSGTYVVGLALRHPQPVLVHQYFDALVSLALVGGFLQRAVTGRTLAVRPGELLLATGPALRALGWMALFFAGLAKANTQFVDPERSCGVALYLVQARAAGFDALLPDATWARGVAIAFALVAELVAPLALLSRRLRPLGLLLAVGLLFLLGINPVALLYEFTAPVVALLFLFTADDLALRVGRGLMELPLVAAVRPAWRWLRPALSAAMVLGVGVGALAGDGVEGAYWRAPACRALWWVGVPTLIGLYLLHLPPLASRPRLAELVRGGAAVTWLVPALMLVNETLPYLGFPHPTSFTMASDLRSLPGHANHLLLPVPELPWNGAVRILEGDTPMFRRIADEGARMNLLTLRQILSAGAWERLVFQVGEGEPETVIRYQGDPRFERPSWAGGWLFHVEPPLGQRCEHWPPEP